MSYTTHFHYIHFIKNTAIFIGNQFVDDNGPELLDYNEIHTGGIKKVHIFYPEWTEDLIARYIGHAISLRKKFILHIRNFDFKFPGNDFSKYVIIDRSDIFSFKISPNSLITYIYHKNDDPMIIATLQNLNKTEDRKQMVVFNNAKYILHSKEQRQTCSYYDEVEEDINNEIFNPYDFNLVDMYGCCSCAECFIGKCIYAYLCSDRDEHEFYNMQTNKLSVPAFR